MEEQELKLFVKAMQQTMEDVKNRLMRLEMSSPSQSKERSTKRSLEEEFDEESEDNTSTRFNKGNNKDNNIGTIKMKIPSFQGKSDPEAYLEWEKKVDRVFECHNYSEEKKVKLAVVEFTDYASVWWDQLVISRRRNGEHAVSTWNEMKVIMRKRFVPQHYYRELYNGLQRLVQGSKSVEQYYQDMEMAMIRANVVEDREATMARFLHGLNRDIANLVELHHYVDLDDMLHMAIKVEKQLKTRSKTNSNSSTPWKSNWKGNEKSNTSSNFKPKGDQGSKKVEVGNNKFVPKSDNSNSRARDLKCFRCLGFGHKAAQCPNAKVMVALANGEIESEDEDEDVSDMPPLEDASNDEGEEMEPLDGSLFTLVTRRALNMQAKEEEVQRENIFHTRCLIDNKLCSMIIDGGSCTNVVNAGLVDKLGLKTTKHPRPYRL